MPHFLYAQGADCRSIWISADMSIGRDPEVTSLTLAAIDAYVQRGTATTTDANWLASHLHGYRMLDAAIASGSDPTLVLGQGFHGILDITPLDDPALDNNRASALPRASGFARFLARDLSGPASDLSIALDLVVEHANSLGTGPDLDSARVMASGRVVDRARVLESARRLAGDLDLASKEVDFHRDPDPASVLARIGVAVYGLVALGVIPVSDDHDTGEGIAGVFLERIASFNSDQLGAFAADVEELLRQSAIVIQDPPDGIYPDLLNMIDSRSRSLRAALSDPEPDPLLVERGTLRLIEAMTRVVGPDEITRLALAAASVSEDRANHVAADLAEVIEDATTNLGNPDPVEDAEIAGPILQRQADVVSVAIDALAVVSPSAVPPIKDDERTPRQRGIERGLEKFFETFLGEKAPELVASAVRTIGTAAIAGSAYAAGLIPGKVAIASAILKALGALRHLFNRLR
jgi:hypothetical protein